MTVILFAATSANADAATGELDVRQCFSFVQRQACPDGTLVRPPNDVVVAPDGRRAYALGGQAIATFTRDPATQALTYAGCVGFSSGGSCTGSGPWTGTFFASYLDVSPDGRHVYAFNGGIWTFAVTPGGLEFASCVHWDAPASTGNCTREPLLDRVIDGEVSPDGSSVYVTTATEDRSVWRLVTLTRSPADGSLQVAGCISQQSQPGCDPVSAIGAMHEPADVELSPDGRSLYVASGDTIDVFDRDPGTGALAFDSCVGNRDGVDRGCGPTTGVFKGVRWLAISPDGRNLYASDPEETTLATFDRADAGGGLSNMRCIGHPSICGSYPQHLGSDAALRVSADGRQVYAIGNPPGNPTLHAYDRDPATGSLAFRKCWTDDNFFATFCDRESRLNVVGGIAVAPDGFSVLTISRDPASALLNWRVQNPPHCDDPGPTAVATSGLTAELSLPCTSVAGHPLTASTVVASPQHGTASAGSQPGTVRYTATSGYTGSDTLQYRVSNDLGDSPVYTLKILVGPASGVPVCADVTTTIAYGAATDVQLTCAAPPGQNTSYRIATPPAGGSLSPIRGDHTVTYSANPGFEGVDQFTYVGQDSDGDSVPAVVRITVNAPPRGLVAGPLTGCAGLDNLLRLTATCDGTAVGWNRQQTGPPGPVGAVGRSLSGPVGDPGADGVVTYPAVRTVVTSWAIPGGRVTEAQTRCGRDEVVVGGAVTSGYWYDGPVIEVPYHDNPYSTMLFKTLLASRPTPDLRGWYGRVRGGNHFYVIAYCLRSK